MRRKLLVWILLLCMLLTTYIPGLGLDYDVKAASTETKDISDWFDPDNVYGTKGADYDFKKMGGEEKVDDNKVKFKGTVGENGDKHETHSDFPKEGTTSGELGAERGVSGTGGIIRIGISRNEAFSSDKINIPKPLKEDLTSDSTGAASAMKQVNNKLITADDDYFVLYATNSYINRYRQAKVPSSDEQKLFKDFGLNIKKASGETKSYGWLMFFNNGFYDHNDMWETTDETHKYWGVSSGLAQGGNYNVLDKTYTSAVKYMDLIYRDPDKVSGNNKTYLKSNRGALQNAWYKSFGTGFSVGDNLNDAEIIAEIDRRLKKAGGKDFTAKDCRSLIQSILIEPEGDGGDLKTEYDKRVTGSSGWMAARLQYFSNGGLWNGDKNVLNSVKFPQRAYVNTMLLYYSFAKMELESKNLYDNWGAPKSNNNKINLAANTNNWSSPYVTTLKELSQKNVKLTHTLVVEDCRVGFINRNTSSGSLVYDNAFQIYTEADFGDYNTDGITFFSGAVKTNTNITGDKSDNTYNWEASKGPLALSFTPYSKLKVDKDGKVKVGRDKVLLADLCYKQDTPVVGIATTAQVYQFLTGVPGLEKEWNIRLDEGKGDSGTWGVLSHKLNTKAVKQKVADDINSGGVNDRHNVSMLRDVMCFSVNQYIPSVYTGTGGASWGKDSYSKCEYTTKVNYCEACEKFIKKGKKDEDKHEWITGHGLSTSNYEAKFDRNCWYIWNKNQMNGGYFDVIINPSNGYAHLADKSKYYRGFKKGQSSDGTTKYVRSKGNVTTLAGHGKKYYTYGASTTARYYPSTGLDYTNELAVSYTRWANLSWAFFFEASGVEPKWTSTKGDVLLGKSTSNVEAKDLEFKYFNFEYLWSLNTPGGLQLCTTNKAKEYTTIKKTVWHDKKTMGYSGAHKGHDGGFWVNGDVKDQTMDYNNGYCQWGFTVIVPEVFPVQALPTPYYKFDVYSQANNGATGVIQYDKHTDGDEDDMSNWTVTYDTNKYKDVGYRDKDLYSDQNRIEIRCSDTGQAKIAKQCLEDATFNQGYTKAVRFNIRVSTESHSSFEGDKFNEPDTWLTEYREQHSIYKGEVPLEVKQTDKGKHKIEKNFVKDFGYSSGSTFITNTTNSGDGDDKKPNNPWEYSQPDENQLTFKWFTKDVPFDITNKYTMKRLDDGWWQCDAQLDLIESIYKGDLGWEIRDNVTYNVYPQEVAASKYTVEMRVHYADGLKDVNDDLVACNPDAVTADRAIHSYDGNDYGPTHIKVIFPKQIKYNYAAVDLKQPYWLEARYTRNQQYLFYDTTEQKRNRYIELKDSKDAANEKYEAMASQVTKDTLGLSDVADSARYMHINVGGQPYILKVEYDTLYNRSVGGLEHMNYLHIVGYKVYTIEGVEVTSNEYGDVSELFGTGDMAKGGETNFRTSVIITKQLPSIKPGSTGTSTVKGEFIQFEIKDIEGNTHFLETPTTSYVIPTILPSGYSFNDVSRSTGNSNEHALAGINTTDKDKSDGKSAANLIGDAPTVAEGSPIIYNTEPEKYLGYSSDNPLIRKNAELPDSMQAGYNGLASTLDTAEIATIKTKLYNGIDCSSPIKLNIGASNRAYTGWSITPVYSIKPNANHEWILEGVSCGPIKNAPEIIKPTDLDKNKYLDESDARIGANTNQLRQCNEVVVLDPITVQPNFSYTSTYKHKDSNNADVTTTFNDFIQSVNPIGNTDYEPTDQRWNGKEFYTTQDNVFLTHDLKMSITFNGDFEETAVDNFGLKYGSDAIGNVVNNKVPFTYNTTPFIKQIGITLPVDCILKNSVKGDAIQSFNAGKEIILDKSEDKLLYNNSVVGTITNGCVVLGFELPLSASEVDQAHIKLKAYAINTPSAEDSKHKNVSRVTREDGDDYKNTSPQEHPDKSSANGFNTVARANKDKTKLGNDSVNAIDKRHKNTQEINSTRQALNLFRSNIGDTTTHKTNSAGIMSNHETEYVQPIDVVGYIGNLTVLDTGDFRYSNLFKADVGSDWLVPNQIHKVDTTNQNNIVTDLSRMDSKGSVAKPAGNVVNGKVPNTSVGSANPSDKLDIFGNLQPFKGNNVSAYELPLSWETLCRYSLTNNKRADAYKFENPKVGYSVYASLETVGNYYGSKQVQYNATDVPVSNGNAQCGPTYDIEQSGVEIRPKYKKKGTEDYLDVFVEVDSKYERVNDSDDGHVGADGVYAWPYTLTWNDEYRRREVLEENNEYTVTKGNKNLLGTINTLFKGNDVMEETINLGNVNKLMLYQEARTFIGDDNNQGISDKAKTQAQRWHFTLGLPSAAKFTEPGVKPKTENFLDISNLEITNTISVVAKGEIWTIAYDNRINGEIPTTAVPEFPPTTPPTNPDEPRNPPEIPVVEYGFPEDPIDPDDPGKPKTAQDDLTIRGTH